MELPQLVVELVGDYSKLMEDIKKARVEAIKQAQFLEKDLNLKISVDDDSLKRLNQHFDLKVTHFKQTQTYFKNNPLKVFVDDDSLTKLNKDLDKLGRKKTNINVSNSGGESSGDVRVSIDNNTDNKEIINSLKSIENAIKAQSKQSLLGSAASGIFAGFTEDIGRNISRMTTRKGVGKIVSKIQAGFKVIDEEIIGKSQVYETFLAELLRNGQVGKAFDVASKRTTIYKQQQRLGKLQVLSDETKTPKEREGAFDQILKEEPALQEQYNSYKAKFSTKSEAEVKKSFIPTVLDKAQPTSISQKVVMPLINEFQPLLRFIQGMQSYNTSVLSQQFYNERKSAFPILGKGENVVSVFGGAENKKGQGGRAIATSLEPLMPGLRFMPVENLDTDATERTADVDNFIKSLLTKFAPDLLSSSSTITNSARQVGFSLNPLASSVGAAQALANTKLAKEQGAEASALSFSLGGADAYRYAKTAEYEGIDTKTMAMAYPFVNFAGAPPKNFKSAILNPDPLSFPFKLGLNNPTPEANILKDTTLPPSASVHGVHHLFKSPQFRTILGETTGVMPIGRDGKVMSRTQQQGSGLQQILIDLERSKKSLSQGFVDIDSVETLSAAKSKLKKYSSEGTEVAKVVAEKLEKEIDEIIERIKEFFKSKNIELPDDLTDLKNFSRYVSEVNKINNNLLSFKSGKKLDNDTGYFSGGLDVATVAERKRELQLETLPWFKSQNFGEYSPIINSGFENLLSVQDEFVKTGGKLSPETIQGINPIPLPNGSEKLLEMQRKVKKDFPTEKFNEENIRLASIPAPDSLKKYPATILAFNKMATSLGAIMPDASEIKTVGFGFGSQAATTLMTDKLAYKTTLDPDGAKKIASEQEIKAYEKLQGRHSPLLYAAKPGEALVTEKIKGTLLRDILESMAEPIKVMQEELSKETNSDKQKEIGARVRDAKEKFNTIAEQLYYNVGQLGGAMHQMGVAHNDLTSGNVFFDKFTVNPSNNKVQFGEGGGVKAIDLERATVNPTGIEKAQDQLTTIEKVFSDPSFRGILDPIRTTKAITSGYANPLPIPEVRQINPKLLTPQKSATQIPIGYSGRSMLQEITGNLHSFKPATILPTYAIGKPYTPTPVSTIPNGYQVIRANPVIQPTPSKDIEMSEKANLAVKSAQELAAKFNANFTRLKSLLKDAERTGNFAPVIELSAAIKQYGDKARSDIEKLRNGAELSSNFATGKSSAQLAQAAGQIASVQNKAARINTLHGGESIGENVGKGVAKGLESSLNDLRNAAEKLADIVPDVVTEKLKMQSPSKVMMEHGKNVGGGLSVGIDNSLKNVKSSSEKLASTVINAVEEKLEIKSPSRWGIRTGENIGDAIGSGARKSLIKANYEIAKLLGTMLRSNSGVIPIKKGSEVALLPSVSGKLANKEKDTFRSFVSETLELINESSMSYADDRMSVDKLLSNIQKARVITGSRVADNVFSTIIGQSKNSNENFSMYPSQTDTRNPEYWRRGNAFRRNLSHYNYGAVSEFGGSLTNYVPEQSGSLVPAKPYLPRSQSLEYYTRDLRPKFGAMTPPGSLVPDKKWLPKVDGSIFGKKNIPDWFAELYPFRDKPGAIVKAQTMAISPYVEQTKGALSVISTPLSSSIVPTKSRSPEFSLPLDAERNSRDFSGMRSSGLYPIVKAQTVGITPYLKLAEGSLEKFSKGGEMAKHLSRIATLLGMDFGKDFNDAMVASLVLSSKRLSELVKGRRGFATDTNNASFVSEGSRYIAEVRKGFKSADGILDQGKITSIVNELNILYEVLTRIGLSLGVTRKEINSISSSSISAVGKAIAPASKVNIPDRPTASSQTIDITSEVVPETNQKLLSGFTQAQKRVMSSQEFYRNYINRNTPNTPIEWAIAHGIQNFDPPFPIPLTSYTPQKRRTGVGAPSDDLLSSLMELYNSALPFSPIYTPPQTPQNPPLSHTIPGARKRGTKPQLPNTSFVPQAYTAPRVPQSISFKIPNTTTPQTTQLPPFLPDGIPQIPQSTIENGVKKNSEPFARFGTMLGKYLGDGFVKGLKFLEGSDSNGIIPAFIRIIDGLKSAVESGDMTSTAERFKNRFSRAFSKGLGSIPGFAEAKERFNIYKDFLKEVANPNVSAALGEGLANGIVGAKELFVDFLKMPEKLVEGFNQVKVAFDSFVEGMNKVQKFGEIMDFLKSSIGNVVKVLGLLVVGKIILDLAPASIEVAANFENLERRIKFTSGSISEGAKNIAFLRSEAKRLNVDLSQTLESGSKFFQATKDTPLEGFQSRQIVSAVTQASAVYGLDLDKQQRTFTALEQMTGKTVVSQEELRQQLAEAIPNASQIAANAYGTTTQSMNQLLSTGRVLAEDFLPKFAQQLKAQTSSGVGDAVNSSVAITNKFNNSLIELQESIGKTLLPFRNFSLSVFASGIDLVTKNFGLLQAVIAMTLIKLSSPVWMMFGAYLKEIPFSLNLIKSAATSMGGAILGIGKAILMFSVQIALVMVALKAFEVGWRQFTDTSGAIGEQTRNVAQTVAERRKKTGVIVPPKPDPNYLDRAGLFYDGTGKQLNDSTERVFEGQQNSIDILNDSNSPAIQAAIQEIQAIDKALDAIKMKRRAVIANNPGDIQALRVLQEQEKELSQKREKPLELFGGNKANLDKQVETLKSYLEYFQEARKDSRLYADEVERIDELIGYVGEDLATVTKEQDRMTKAIKNSLTEMQKFAIEIRSLEAKFNDLRQSRDTALSVEKTGLFDLASSGNITPGQNEYTANLKTQSNLIGKIGDNLKQIREMSAQLEIKGLSDVLSTQGLTKNSGIDTLKAAEEKATDGSKEKEILQGYIKVREMQVQTIDMQMQLSEQKYNLTQSLYQQNKQIQEYYLSLNKQAQEITQVYKELVNTNNLNTAKNKIRSAVLGYQDNFITQFADSIIQILDTLNQPVVALLQGQREIDQAKFNLLNEKRQIQETQRSNLSPITPGNGKVTSEFGWRTIFGQRQHHNGIDYGVPIGTPVKAPTSGKVSNVFNDVGGGLTVTLSNINAAGQKVEQSFLHLSQSLVKVGDVVQKGQVIAKSGNSGSKNTGAHLDYRVKVDGKYINPRDFLKSSVNTAAANKIGVSLGEVKSRLGKNAQAQVQQPQEFVSPQLQQAERNLQNTITNAQTKINIEASQSYITATAQENKALMALDRARMENRRSPIGVFREIEDMGLNLSQQNPERELLSQKFQIERNGEDKLHQITMAKFDQENIKGANEDLLAKVREDTKLRPAFKTQAIKQLESVVAESKKIIEEYDEYLKLVPELTAAAIEKLNSEYLISENLRKFSLNQQISQAQASALRSKSRGNLQLNSQADSMDLNSKYAGEISGLDEEIRKESDPEMIKLKQEQKKLALIAALIDGSNIQRNLKIQERDLEFSQKEKLISSNNAISSEVIKGKGLFGVKDKNLEKAQALSQIKMDFEREKMEIEKLGESGNYSSDYIEKLTNNLNKLNELKLDNVTKEFNMFTEAISGVKGDVDGIFKDFFMNTKSFGESISAVFQSILNNLANMASKELSNQLFSSVLGMGGKSSGGGGGGGGGFSSGGFDFSSGFDLGGGLDFGSAELPSFAKGGMVGDLLNKERSLSGFNPRLIIANEGERVLTPKETKLWNQLNSSNKLESFSSGGMVGQGLGNINNVGRSGDTINITPNVNINNEGGGNINKALFEKALEAKIQETIKQERRPGGSLNRGGLYDR